MENYSFHNLCSWTSSIEIVCPMSPAFAIKPIREIMRGKFGGLARVLFHGQCQFMYQEVDGPNDGLPNTGYDALIYKAIYKNAVSLLFFIDIGIGLNPVAEMTKINDQETKITFIDPERDKKFWKTLSEQDMFVMLERANAFIKINQKDESKQPAITVSI